MSFNNHIQNYDQSRQYLLQYFNIASYFQKIASSYTHMNSQDLQEVQVQPVTFDCNLHILFRDFQNQTKLAPSTSTFPTIICEEPEHYDPKDIENDYKSQCLRTTRRIKKKKRPKIGINLVGKARKERKNKLYIQMLENRIFQLQKEVESLKKANKVSKQTKNHDSDHIVNGFFVNRQRHYEKLLNYVKQNKLDEQKFMEEYNMLRIRQGAVGKDRIKVINYYFKQLSEIMITDLQKYILKTAQEQTDLFDPNYSQFGAIGSYVEQWRKDIVNELQLSYEKVAKISQIKQEIMIERNRMEGYFSQFYDMKLKILESSRRMEMIYDRLNESFSPRQIAKCLCLIEKYKFEKGFSIQDIFKNIFSKLQLEQKQCYDPDNLYEII